MPTMAEVERRAAAELATFTQDDAINLLLVAATAIFGVWVMTYEGAGDGDEQACALCGQLLDPAGGMTYLPPKQAERLGLGLSDPICPSCARRVPRR